MYIYRFYSNRDTKFPPKLTILYAQQNKSHIPYIIYHFFFFFFGHIPYIIFQLISHLWSLRKSTYRWTVVNNFDTLQVNLPRMAPKHRQNQVVYRRYRFKDLPKEHIEKILATKIQQKKKPKYVIHQKRFRTSEHYIDQNPKD